MENVRHNFHIHTLQSSCAKPDMTVENIIFRAEEEGLEIIGLSDHFHQQNRDFFEMASTLRQELDVISTPIDVLVGCEAQMISPVEVSIDQNVARILDYVMISADHYHLSEVENPKEHSALSYAVHYLKMHVLLVSAGGSDRYRLL